MLRAGPNPSEFLNRVWLEKSPVEFRLWQIAEMADTFQRNHSTLLVKAEALNWTFRMTVAEVLLIAAALVLSRM